MAYDDDEELWKFKPSDDMENILSAVTSSDGVILTLSVQKPGCETWKGSITLVGVSKKQVYDATRDMGPKWNEQHCLLGTLFRAFRVWPIKGTPFIICWTVEHEKLDKSGTTYRVNDSIGWIDTRTLPS